MPLVIAVVSPCTGPSFTGYHASPSGRCLTEYTNVPGARALDRGRRGGSVASVTVSTSIRMLTNWFGNSARSAFANSALSLTVPVVVSIWLSAVRSLPVASFTLLVAIPRFDGDRFARREAAEDLRQVVLGDRMNDGDAAAAAR